MPRKKTIINYSVASVIAVTFGLTLCHFAEDTIGLAAVNGITVLVGAVLGGIAAVKSMGE